MFSLIVSSNSSKLNENNYCEAGYYDGFIDFELDNYLLFDFGLGDEPGILFGVTKLYLEFDFGLFRGVAGVMGDNSPF